MKRLAPMLLLCIALLSGCGNAENTAPTESATTETVAPIAVSVQTVGTGDIQNSTKYNGRTEVKSQTTVSGEMGGKISKIHVVEGQYVNKGDVLLTLDGSDLQKQLDTAKAAVNTAQTSYNNAFGGSINSQLNQLETAISNAQLQYDEAKRNYDLYLQLFESGTITEDAFKKVELALKQTEQALASATQTYDTTKNEVIPDNQALAKSSLEQAQASYNATASNLNKLTVVAPNSGTITASNFHEGEMLGAGSPAFIISNLSSLDVSISVTEGDLSKFKIGNTVNIEIAGEIVSGKVTEIPEVTDSNAAMYTIKMTIDNSQGKFKSGMTAVVELTTAQTNDAIVIPKKAIFEEDGTQYVYLCKDNTAVKSAIETGLTNSYTVEILSGINAGDTVVTGGLSLISDGTYLYPVEKGE